ncbi:MAG: hypothetical protein MJE66_19605 [Proteobacteria bacterium]|nr:hypothetical protein [Pseudomonadota bacterium]
MNRPDPVCPKCDTDQRERPKQSTRPAPRSSSRPSVKPMAPLLDDDDDATGHHEEIDLGVGNDESSESLEAASEFLEDAALDEPEEESDD